MSIATGSKVELDNLIITGGDIETGSDVNGGGIDNGGALTLVNCTVTGNTAAGQGGGLANEDGGSSNVNNSTFSNNHAKADITPSTLVRG